MSDGQDSLLARAKAGGRDALGELLTLHTPGLRGHLRGRIPGKWQSLLSEDDVVQQTLADSIRGITRVTASTDQSYASWLRTTADNNLSDAIKALEAEKRGGDRNRVDTVRRGDVYTSLLTKLPASGTTPTGRVGRPEAKALILRALEQLPEPYAKVISLYDLEERPSAEVAKLMGRSVGAVLMLRLRALTRLTELLAPKLQSRPY